MRILLMTANFAPRSGSHPTRTVHLTKYLHRLGHELRVITYAANQLSLYSVPDVSLSAKVPEDVEVVRISGGWVHRTLERFKGGGGNVTRLKQTLGAHPLTALMIPDPHFSARQSFVRAGNATICSWRPDVLITCAYPYTFTLIGAELRRRHQELTWIADYGDPWTGAPIPELSLPCWRRRLDARLERAALRHADGVTVTSNPTAALYRQQFPEVADRVRIITMGFDPEDAATVIPQTRPVEDENRVILLHAGRLYESARDPIPFIRALERCLATDPIQTERLRIVLLGQVEPAIQNAISSSAAKHLFRLEGWVSVEESIARMKSADHLLLFGNSGAMQIPGKVFQYIGTGRPIFMTSESMDDPTLDIIREYGNGQVVPNRTDDLAIALQGVLASGSALTTTTSQCDRFSWPHLAAEVAEIALMADRLRRTGRDQSQ